MQRFKKFFIESKQNIIQQDEENLDEISTSTLSSYSIKAARQGDTRIAGQKMADEKIRKKDGYSSTAKVSAK